MIQVKGGLLRGREDHGVSAYLGIPYAAPPYGERRLRPPEPPEPWDGVREATEYGPTCPKHDDGDPLFPEVTIPGLDCLNLNVWTPGGSGLPVLVWIHGGMFVKGSGSLPGYRGSAFARDGVVCVTINYRLGAEGFLSLPDGTPNLGLLDMIAALEWVRDNIAAFGGDPDRVTIAGQSAGAMSVATLLAVPRARGLFVRAIAQSGAVAQTLTAAEAGEVAARLAGSLGVEPAREAFLGIDAGRLAEAASALVRQSQSVPDPAKWSGLPFAPFVDGDLLPCHPLEAVQRVPLLIGWNRDDVRIGLVPTGMIDALGWDAVTAVARALGAPEPARDGHPGDLLAALTTDCFMRLPALRLAEARMGSADTWLYRFDHESTSFGGRLRAAHAVELPYVFDLLEEESGHALIGADPPQEVADTAHGAWVRFVTAGDPGWPRHDRDGRSVGLIDHAITVTADPGGWLA